MTRMRCLIVIPARNEEKTIEKVVRGLRDAVPGFARLVVNDASTDATGAVLERLGETQIKLPLNLGYGGALQTGLKYALARGYDLVVCIDADGQHRPEDVPALVDAMKQTGADLVIGSRFIRGRTYTGTLSRRIGQSVFSALTRFILPERIYDTTSGFKVLNMRACEAMSTGVFLDFHIESIVRLSLLGLRVVEHPIQVDARSHGRSMHTFANALQYPFKTLILTVAAIVDGLLHRGRI